MLITHYLSKEQVEKHLGKDETFLFLLICMFMYLCVKNDMEED